jgi:hypothetical protein
MNKPAIRACIRCGSRRLRWASASEGRRLIGFEGVDTVCQDCHWHGQPLEFEDEASWKAFVGGLNREGHA